MQPSKLSSALTLLCIVSLARSDILSLYTGDNCAGNNVLLVEDLEPFTCYDVTYGQAQSFVLTADDNATYSIYPDIRCRGEGGQLSLEGCQLSSAFGALRKEVEATRRVRTSRVRQRSVTKLRDIGDTMICPNSGYFLQATAISAATGDLTVSEEQEAEASLGAAVDSVRPGGNSVESESTGSQGQVLVFRLRLTDGTVNQISPGDLEDIAETFFVFRDMERGPLEFTVNLWTGRPDQMAQNIGQIEFFLQ